MLFHSLFSLLMGTSFCLAAATPRIAAITPVIVARSADLQQTEAIGSRKEGRPFSTMEALSKIQLPHLDALTLRGAKRLDAITFTLGTRETYHYGGNGGSPVTLALGTNEFITKVELCDAVYSWWLGTRRIFYMEAFTNIEGKGIKMGDKSKHSNVACTTINVPSGRAIIGAFGRSGDEIDQLGFITAPR